MDESAHVCRRAGLRLDRPGISGTVVGLSERIRKKSIKILFSCNQLLILSEYIVKAVSKAQEKKALGILEAESSIEGKRHPESGGISPKKFRKAA